MKRVTAEGGYTIIVESNRYNPLLYPHMVRMEGHNILRRSYLLELVNEVLDDPEVKCFEAHFYPRWGKRLWKLYEGIMEKYVPQRFLAYNAVMSKKR